MAGTYLRHWQDHVETVANFAQQAILIGGVRTDVGNVGNGVTSIADQIPNLARGSDLANANAKLDTQAILIGGVQSRANSIYIDTQAIRNNDLPRLATGNQANGISNSIATLRTETGNIPRAIYNASFATINTRLDGISTQLTGISANQGGGGGSTTVSLNATSLVVPYVVNAGERDLIYLLSAGESGYQLPANVIVGVSASTLTVGSANNIVSRNGSYFATDNIASSFVTLDLGFNKPIRTITLTGVGIKSFAFGGGKYPVNLIISGSNNNSSYTAINAFSNIGFTGNAQWKYTTFSNSNPYRYIRITQSGFNALGDNILGFGEIRLFGTITNP